MKYTPDFCSRFRILKGGKISLVVSALIAGSTMSFAAPTGGQVTTGSAAINQNGSITTINQTSNKASINWNSFSIAPTETVNFVQPSASSVTLNRVIGTTPSLIEGAMNANGQVFLLNPNGVLFANGSQINVGGLVASTLNITDENFQAGNYLFEGNSQNSIINMGTITTSNGGYVAMMGKTVQNEGTIVATMGNVQMASGEKISLNLNGNSLVKLTIDQGTLNALVENKGLIQADGGEVYLTTQALNTILDGMVNNTGIIEAKTLNDVTGEVILFAHGGTANISGTIDATGGFVETSGTKLGVSDGTVIKAKEWLLDPTDITIASGGVDGISGSNISGATINAVLDAGTSVLLDATNNITVNDNISKTTGGDVTLTLKAGNNIVMNDGKSISSSTGKLDLVLWSDSDATNGGSIYLKNGSSITTNGGHLWMGGGSGTTTWNGLTVGDGYAVGTSAGIDLTNATLGVVSDNYYGTGNRFHYNGITLLNNNINTSGGDFKASGKSYNTAVTSIKAYIGVFIGGDYQISTSAGDIVLDGISTISANDSSWYNGVALGSANIAGTANATLITTSGDIAITGEVNQNINAGHARAISMSVWGSTNKLNLKTTSGNIALTGDNKSTVSNSTNRAIGNDVDGYRFTEISSATGNIDITGIGDNTGGYDIGLKNTIIKTDGVITITGDTLNLLSSYSTGSQISSVTNGIGSLVIKPYTASTSIGIGGATGTLALTSAYFSTNFLDGFSGITVGSSLQSGDIAIGATAFSDALSLYTTGTVTQTGAITGNQNLNLLGTGGIYTLDNIANNINTLTANTGKVTFVDSDGLTLGAITTTDLIDIASTSGNITLNGNIATTNTTADAININAGKSTAAGTSTGGNIIHTSGTITTGTNGRATIYSGSIAGSTGLSTLLGSGSGHFRYNSDETSTGYTTALGSGIYAIYREQPTILIAPDTKTITYGESDPAFTYISSGYANGDTNAILSGTAAFSITGTTSTAGKYTAGAHNINYTSGLANGLGYALSDKTSVTDELTVNKKDLAVSGLTASNKTYDGSTVATLGGTAVITALGSDVVTLGGTVAGTFATKDVGTAKAITVTGNTISGTDAGNYNLVQQIGLTADIAQKELSISGLVASNKTYDGSNSVTMTNWGSVATGITGEALTLNHTSASFGDANAADGKIVTATGYSLADGTGGVATNYTLASTTATTTANIAKADATVTATSDTKTYNGVAQSVSGFSATGLVNGETIAVLDGVTATGTGTNAGTYGVTASGTDENYNLTFVNGSLVIAKADATVTAASDTKTYNGVAQSVSGFSATGLVNGETIAVLDGVTATGTGTNAGTYGVTASGTDENYNLTFVNGSLVIAKADATVTATSDTKTYNGVAQSVSGFSATGLVNGETISVLSGVSGAIATGTNAGTYNTALSGTDENYNLTFVDGKLTIIAPSGNPVEDIVTTIVNQTTVAPPSPIVVALVAPQQSSQAQTQTTLLLQAIMPSSRGESFSLVGTTDGMIPVQTMSMEQLQQTFGGQGINEIRVALGQDSFVELVNGGVNLPLGLSQEFYVLENIKNKQN
jgi:filamentous hemagglutinin family protein